MAIELTNSQNWQQQPFQDEHDSVSFLRVPVVRITNKGWIQHLRMEQTSFLLNKETLLGGLEHFYDFPYIGNHNPNLVIFFRGVETTNKNICWFCLTAQSRISGFLAMNTMIVDNGE